MLDWVLAPGDVRPLVRTAAPRALGGGEVLVVALPIGAGRKLVTIVRTDAAQARRAPAWPELLVDWSEIHETPPFPRDAAPALAQALSALGAPSFAVAFDPERDAAAVAWYERGALLLLEQVGRATVAWSPEGGLGRPDMSGIAGGAAALARTLGGDENILDRIEAQHAAGARAIVERALVRLCDRPPAVDDLEGSVALAPAERIRLA